MGAPENMPFSREDFEQLSAPKASAITSTIPIKSR